MKKHLIAILTTGLVACGGSPPPADTTPPADTGGTGGTAAGDSSAPFQKPARRTSDAGKFAINEADESSRPFQAKLKATDTMAALRFLVVDKKKGAIRGIVISLTSSAGEKFYTAETDADGFAEVLVPIGQTYDLVYLSLGRHDIAAKVEVANTPRLNLKLTMRYEREEIPTGDGPPEAPPAPRFVLEGVQFETGKATLTGDSHARLDTVVEYMTHKPSARIEVSGHTDNVGKQQANKKLSQKRADAVRDYLVSQGIDAGRIDAIGYGDERPIASNDTPEGRQKNRRIEATER